jgi:hypothetical protein
MNWSVFVIFPRETGGYCRITPLAHENFFHDIWSIWIGRNSLASTRFEQSRIASRSHSRPTSFSIGTDPIYHSLNRPPGIGFSQFKIHRETVQWQADEFEFHYLSLVRRLPSLSNNSKTDPNCSWRRNGRSAIQSWMNFDWFIYWLPFSIGLYSKSHYALINIDFFQLAADPRQVQSRWLNRESSRLHSRPFDFVDEEHFQSVSPKG